MAITGTGTQADPFTFDPTGMTADEVWADFKACLYKEGYQSENSYSYCSLPEDYILDFNDVHDTIDSSISIRINVVIGNGFTIKNLGSEITLFKINRYPHKLYDIKIINAYAYSLIENYQGSESAGTISFFGCEMTGLFTTSKFVIGADNYTSGNRNNFVFDESPYSRKGCGINIECSNGDFIMSGKASPYCGIYNSHVTFKGKHFTYALSHAHISAGGGSSSNPTDSDSIRLKNSLIEGEFDYLYLTGGTNSSVINVEMDSTNGRLYCESTSTGNIYNSDKATLTYAQPNAQLVGVTDAQLKDPEYLNSIGFDIGDNTGGTS